MGKVNIGRPRSDFRFSIPELKNCSHSLDRRVFESETENLVQGRDRHRGRLKLGNYPVNINLILPEPKNHNKFTKKSQLYVIIVSRE